MSISWKCRSSTGTRRFAHGGVPSTWVPTVVPVVVQSDPGLDLIETAVILDALEDRQPVEVVENTIVEEVPAMPESADVQITDAPADFTGGESGGGGSGSDF